MDWRSASVRTLLNSLWLESQSLENFHDVKDMENHEIGVILLNVLFNIVLGLDFIFGKEF